MPRQKLFAQLSFVGRCVRLHTYGVAALALALVTANVGCHAPATALAPTDEVARGDAGLEVVHADADAVRHEDEADNEQAGPQLMRAAPAPATLAGRVLPDGGSAANYEAMQQNAQPEDFCAAPWIYRDDLAKTVADARGLRDQQHYEALAAAQQGPVEADDPGNAADDDAANTDDPTETVEPATNPAPAPIVPQPPAPTPAPVDLPVALGPQQVVIEPAGPRFFDNVDVAAKSSWFACVRAEAFFPLLATRYDALGRCSVDESKLAVERYGAGAFVVCKDATYVGCSSQNGVERYHFNYTRELWQPAPPARRRGAAPLASAAYVVLPPERTLRLEAPLDAWRASPPNLRRADLPAWAQGQARCLSCDQSPADSQQAAGQRGRCLEEHLVALQRLGSTVLQQDPTAQQKVLEKARALYLQTPQQWRVLHHPDQAFLPMPWEQNDALLQSLQAAQLPERSLAHLSMCTALSRNPAHPGRLQAHAATCLERAAALLPEATWAALAPSFATAFAEVAP